jgi:hypothetical protein
MLPDLAKAGPIELRAASLETEMARLDPDPDTVVKLAAQTIEELDRLILGLEAGKLDEARLAPVIRGLAAAPVDPRVSWDRATQGYLARLALIRAGLIPDDPALRAIFELLKFPEKPQRYDSPRSLEIMTVPGPER